MIGSSDDIAVTHTDGVGRAGHGLDNGLTGRGLQRSQTTVWIEADTHSIAKRNISRKASSLRVYRNEEIALRGDE